MTPIVSSLFAKPDLSDLSTFQNDPLTSSYTKVSFSNQKSADLSIVTAEGDRVILSPSTSLQLGYASYNHRGELTGGTASLQSLDLSLERSREFSISVDGN